MRSYLLPLALVLCCLSGAGAQGQKKALPLSPCRLAGWNEDVRCGTFEVPEDRHSPNGRKILLRIVVEPASNQNE
ncbi:MAG TPA: hypothetical protein VGI80_02355, partial [Pyrinomonadaceae bacterium]